MALSGKYGKENEVSADVLIVGGGIAGCHAAISAAKAGAKVAVVEKGTVLRSGSGGDGVDHWHLACTNPASKITPEEMVETSDPPSTTMGTGSSATACAYISCKESYDALLDVEKMGVKVRDVDDNFVGAPFRDEETKLLFAYDYDHKFAIRVAAAAVKPALYRELRRLKVGIYDRIIVTGLLTEGGTPGSRVVGAMGVNMHTGEFHIFKAKATIIATAKPTGLWVFSTELKGMGTLLEPNHTAESFCHDVGCGRGIHPDGGLHDHAPDRGLRQPAVYYRQFPQHVVCMQPGGREGKEIPWVDRDGKILKTVEERNHCAPGQGAWVYDGPHPIPDLPERIARGEFKLPLYADLPGMPEYDRRAIWGLMIGNEGKTLVPVYWTFQKWGFDPDKDMLQVSMQPPDYYIWGAWWKGYGPRQWRGMAGGGPVFDWDLRTNLEGLYVAGTTLACGSNHSGSATRGRYAGRKAAEYAASAPEPSIERQQVDVEKARVYAPIHRRDGMGWKELKAGLCKIMQDYCGESKNEEALRMGLRWLSSLRESEIASAYARNPTSLGAPWKRWRRRP